jgi:hypothetical protein
VCSSDLDTPETAYNYNKCRVISENTHYEVTITSIPGLWDQATGAVTFPEGQRGLYRDKLATQDRQTTRDTPSSNEGTIVWTTGTGENCSPTSSPTYEGAASIHRRSRHSTVGAVITYQTGSPTRTLGHILGPPVPDCDKDCYSTQMPGQ